MISEALARQNLGVRLRGLTKLVRVRELRARGIILSLFSQALIRLGKTPFARGTLSETAQVQLRNLVLTAGKRL